MGKEDDGLSGSIESFFEPVELFRIRPIVGGVVGEVIALVVVEELAVFLEMVEIEPEECEIGSFMAAVARCHSPTLHGSGFVALVHVVVTEDVDYGVIEFVEFLDEVGGFIVGVGEVSELEHEVDAFSFLGGFDKGFHSHLGVGGQAVMDVGDDGES